LSDRFSTSTPLQPSPPYCVHLPLFDPLHVCVLSNPPESTSCGDYGCLRSGRCSGQSGLFTAPFFFSSPIFSPKRFAPTFSFSPPSPGSCPIVTSLSVLVFSIPWRPVRESLRHKIVSLVASGAYSSYLEVFACLFRRVSGSFFCSIPSTPPVSVGVKASLGICPCPLLPP